MLKNIVLTGGIGDIFMDALKTLTFWIDHAIYWLVGIVYQIFYKLAGFDLLGTSNGQTVLTNITDRIYVILGIAMVFVLAFNLLNYIIDPDKVKDKNIGASTFIKDIVIALVIISILKPVFSKLYDFQTAVLNEGTIFNLVLGGNAELNTETTQNPVEQGAGIMIASVYSAFLRPVTVEGESTKTSLDCPTGAEGEATGALSESFKGYCDAYSAAKIGYGIDAFEPYVTNKDFEFTPFLTTVAGIALLVFMFMFCFQLAKRVGKLAILQLIAPIPLILEVLPNKKGTRKKWFETLLKVYLDAFIYLIIVTFIVLLITLVPAAIQGLWESPGELGLIASIILIFGLLMFAKEAPQMLLDLLGIKSTNLFKDSFAMTKKGGAMAAFLGGTAGSMLGNGLNNYNDYVSQHKTGNVLKNIGYGFKGMGSGIAGAASTLTHNVMGAKNVHTIKDANNLRKKTDQTVVTNRMKRDAYALENQDKFLGSIGGHASDAWRSVRQAAQAYTGIPVGKTAEYQSKRAAEQASLELKNNFLQNFEGIYSNDAQYSQAKADFNKYNRMFKNGLAIDGTEATDATTGQKYWQGTDGKRYDINDNRVRDHVTGLTYSELKQQAETMRNARQEEVMKLNADKVAYEAGKLQNWLNNHQGIEGISSDQIDVDNIINRINKGEALDVVKDIEGIVKSGVDSKGNTVGYKATLDSLTKDQKYQEQRRQERLRADAKEVTQKAAEQANQNKQGDKK